METTMVICYNLEDFRRWLFDHYGYTGRLYSRKIIMVNNICFFGVSEENHLRGYRYNNVEYTSLGFSKENFNLLFTMATQYCLARPKKEFKFGR